MLWIDEVLQHQVPLIHSRGHRLRFRNVVLKGVGLQDSFNNVFDGCAVSDLVGNVEAMILRHRTVPFSSAGGGQ